MINEFIVLYLLNSVLLLVAKQLVTGHPFSKNGFCPKPNWKSFIWKYEVKYKIFLVKLVTISSFSSNLSAGVDFSFFWIFVVLVS